MRAGKLHSGLRYFSGVAIAPDGGGEPVIEIRYVALTPDEAPHAAKADNLILGLLQRNRPVAIAFLIPLVEPAPQRGLAGGKVRVGVNRRVTIGFWVAMHPEHRRAIGGARTPQDQPFRLYTRENAHQFGWGEALVHRHSESSSSLSSPAWIAACRVRTTSKGSLAMTRSEER